MTKEEFRSAIDAAESIEEVEALEKEFNDAEAEVVEEVKEEAQEEVAEATEEAPAVNVAEEVKEISAEEERSLLHKVVEAKKLNLRKVEDNTMEERKFGLDSAEYRSAWAKKMMGLKEDRLTENEKRALGDAVTTTATTFVEADADTQGINNGGLFIPESVRNEFMEIISKQSPIFRDVRKLQVRGNIDLPYIFGSDDAAWYAELTDTVNEGIEFKNMQLTGWELAKDIVITWKAEEMTVEGFIGFLLEEMANKMGAKLIDAVIYGDGSGKPTGITNGLEAVTTGDDAIETILDTKATLGDEAKIGAKVYISDAVSDSIVGYKDQVGNRPYLAGVPAIAGTSVEVDPYLKNNDIVVGNMRNYILNEHTPVRVDKETSVKGRKVTYGAYAIYDGKAKPGAFAYGQFTPAASI